jgi:hypothetical protein
MRLTYGQRDDLLMMFINSVLLLTYRCTGLLMDRVGYV